MNSIRESVYATGDKNKIDFFTTYGVYECFIRNLYSTQKCNAMLSEIEKQKTNGYTFTTLPDTHSRIIGYKNGKEESIRLCKNAACRYYHSDDSKREKIVCLEYCFGVCKHKENHGNKVHSSLAELPSYCIHVVHKEEQTYFFYHNMVRIYEKHSKHTYVIECGPNKFALTDKIDIHQRKHICNEYVNYLKDVYLSFPYTQIPDTTTYVVSHNLDLI